MRTKGSKTVKYYEFDAIVSTMLTSDDEVQIEANAREAFITEQEIQINADLDDNPITGEPSRFRHYGQ
jgi:hypothetical protein